MSQTEEDLAEGSAQWYAAYTRSRHEKRVAEQLEQRGVEHFLPLYEATHRWKDRRVCLPLPLFPGYIFLRLQLENRLRVLQIPSVVHLVGSNGNPIAIEAKEIHSLRDGLRSAVHAEPHPYLTVGRRVRVKRGPLQGAFGVLVRKKNKLRFVISIDLIMRSVSVEIDIADLELVA
jgi:transcription antitermination factor NusG